MDAFDISGFWKRRMSRRRMEILSTKDHASHECLILSQKNHARQDDEGNPFRSRRTGDLQRNGGRGYGRLLQCLMEIQGRCEDSPVQERQVGNDSGWTCSQRKYLLSMVGKQRVGTAGSACRERGLVAKLAKKSSEREAGRMGKG